MLIYANSCHLPTPTHLIPDWVQLFHPRQEISQFKSTFAWLGEKKKAGAGGSEGGGWISFWADVVAVCSRQKYVKHPHSVRREKKKDTDRKRQR